MNNLDQLPSRKMASAGRHRFPMRTIVLAATAICVLAIVSAAGVFNVIAGQPRDEYRSGERLTYNISFNNYDSAAYAEIRVVSKGKLEGKDAVELYGKLRSGDLLGAVLYLWDDARTTYVSPDTGYPLYIRSVSNAGLLPAETVKSYLSGPSSRLDLLSLIYKVRQSRGVGSFAVQESGQPYVFDFVQSGSESVSTEAGGFETGISSVTSQYLAERGIRDFRINFSSDERALPVLVRFRTERGEFTAKLASIQDLTPEVSESPKPETPKPTPSITPTPDPTPRPYIDNQPLSPDLPFELGESLRYRVTKKGSPVAEVVVSAKERKQYQGVDSLLLSATVESLGAANDLFGPQDAVLSWVDPVTLAPF
jgi:hypothetical protein